MARREARSLRVLVSHVYSKKVNDNHGDCFLTTGEAMRTARLDLDALISHIIMCVRPWPRSAVTSSLNSCRASDLYSEDINAICVWRQSVSAPTARTALRVANILALPKAVEAPTKIFLTFLHIL